MTGTYAATTSVSSEKSRAEIEKTLTEYDGVRQVAVVGVPDARSGEVCAAFIVPRPGTSIEPQAVIDWARARMANFKVPRYVYVVDDLVYNPSGKVMKSALLEQHLVGLAESAEVRT